MRLSLVSFVALVVLKSMTAAKNSRAPGTVVQYRVLPDGNGGSPPFESVALTFGPAAKEDSYARWIELSITKKDAGTPACIVRLLVTADFPGDPVAPADVYRYLLLIPETDETYEYRNVRTELPWLPQWKDFTKYFFPYRAQGAGDSDGLPHTLHLMGHVLTLREVRDGAQWREWEEVKRLDLDPELLIGTGREMRDATGERLPQKPERQDYQYVRFTPEDYRTMIDAGVNLFTLTDANEVHVRGEPVFYRRGAGGDPALRIPADLYRSNYIGGTMFMDEPTMRLTSDGNVNTVLKYFSDFAAVISNRVHAQYHGEGGYGAYSLEHQLAKQDVSFGDMRLMQYDYPSWETMRETTFYQMQGGGNGLVHEGRYQLAEFNDGMKHWTGVDREYTPEQYLRYEYALLRGGTRPFGKFWGMSIYGQADPAISPLAVTLAYDMGARYVWYWTSDHDHHLPFPEQMELTRHLRQHAADHERESIYLNRAPQRELAIVIPYGYFLTLAHQGDNPHSTLWWVRELDREGKNESSQRYARLMKRAHLAVIEAFDKNEDFDITVDDGRQIKGYERIVRVDDQE